MSPAARAAAKIVGLVLFAAVVVALPRDVVWPYAIPFVVALVFLVRARAPWRWVLPRLTVEIPFLVFAMLYNINPGYTGQFFIDERLIAIGLGGLVWMAIGAGIMAKMIRFEI